MKRITAALLRKHEACKDAVRLFEKTWPDGAPVNLINVRKAIGIGLGVNWFIEHCLSAPAQEIYNKAIAAAQNVYRKVVDVAWDKAIAIGQETCNGTMATAREVYREMIVAVRKDYNEARASALVKAIEAVEEKP